MAQEAKDLPSVAQNSSLKEIQKACLDYLDLGEDDKWVIDAYISVITATLHRGIPEFIWIYVVGPPGCGKTEIVCLMLHNDHFEFIDDLTEHALTSGYEDDTGNDPSLLLRLDGKILVIKDLGDFAENNPKLVDKIFGELRAIYDKNYVKASGVAGTREYSTRFGITAATTEVIDRFSERHRQLGERFLAIRMTRIPLTLEQRRVFSRKCVGRMMGKDAWQTRLRGIVQDQINQIAKRAQANEALPQVASAELEIILSLADTLCLLRAMPIEGTAMQPEMGSRVAQQLVGIVQARAFADGRSLISAEDIVLARRIVMDSLPVVRRRMMWWLYRRGYKGHQLGASKEQIAQICGTTPGVIESVLVQYVHSKVLEPASVITKHEDSVELYRLTKPVFELMKHSGLFDGEQVKVFEEHN
jgi:hypothetical protein